MIHFVIKTEQLTDRIPVEVGGGLHLGSSPSSYLFNIIMDYY